MHQQDVNDVRGEGGWDHKVGPPSSLRGCESLFADGIDYSNSLLDSDLAFFLSNTYRSLVYADGGD
jgi:hypothetical protein